MANGYVINDNENSRLLLEGMWYSNLPNIIDMNEIVLDLENIIQNIRNEKYLFYKYDKDKFIIDWKNINSPKYIRKLGVEAITFYDFKNNRSLREMQIPHLLHYLSFVYNTIFVFWDLFAELYINGENSDIISSSNSYLVFEESFVVQDYDEEVWVSEGTFTTKNNKIHSSAIINNNKRRMLEVEKDYMYSLKMDVESFFPNLYTHNFEKIAERPPFKDLISDKKYFKFLDKFNQRINNNQTKGIPAGIFSSHIAAELCMLCVDYEINEYINTRKLDIGYIRYVDDLTFFSDSKECLSEIFAVVQNVLNKYRLRINGSKTEHSESVLLKQQSYIEEIEFLFAFLGRDNINFKVELNTFFLIKKYLGECINDGRISQCKTFLGLFYNKLKENKLTITNVKDEIFNYLIKLAFIEEQLAPNVYQIIDKIMDEYNESTYSTILIKKKNKIDREYPDTLIQIWHYYVMFKHCNDKQEQMIFSDLNTGEYNPLIIASMVKYGENQNREIFEYIVSSYKAEIKSEEWEKTIMFSKWWLPLLKIKRYDKYNYYNFMNSNNFIDVFNDFSNS